MEANKIEIKSLVISLATIVSIEVATSFVISRGLYSPMIILGATRLLEIILIILIVLIWGAFVVLSAAGSNPLKLIQVQLPTKHSEIALFFLIGGMVGPIAEEVFFRGILYGFFRRWGVVVGLVLSTLIFVLMHPINHGVPITQVVGGIVFALAYEVEGSLMVPITIHSLGNMAIFALSLISFGFA